MRQRLLIALAVIGCHAATWGDVITLRDGTRLEGELKRTPDGWEVTTADGKKNVIPAMKVKGVELTKPAAGGSLEKLESLRRSVAFSEDLPRIIDRYKRFIDQNKNTPLEAPARKDLAVWQDRLDRKLVKSGSKWITPEESRAVSIAGLRAADEARGLIAAKRFGEAEQLLTKTLETDAHNMSALYLLSVLQLRGGQFPIARKGFETVAAAIPNHAPSLNNVALILYRQKQFGGALTIYLQALTAAQGNRVVLDNVAEALAALPESEHKSPQAQKLGQAFVAEDLLVQQDMKAKGLYRWGASWVDKETFDKLQAAEKEVKKRLESLQADFNLTSGRIKQLDSDIRSSEQAMNEIESRSYIRAGDGTLIRVPYPQAYYDLQRDVGRLNGERDTAAQRLEALRVEAKKVQADLPVPKYSGVQKIVGEEGVPFVLPDGVSPDDVFPPPAGKEPPPASQPVMTAPPVPDGDDPRDAAPATSIPPLLARPTSKPASQPTTRPTR